MRYADSGEGWEPLGALVFSQQFNERLAVIASVSYDKQQFQTDVLGGQNRGGWRFSNRNDRATVTQNYFAPEYRYATDRDEERERLGASVAVAFRPTDATEIEAQWFASDLDILTQEGSMKFASVRAKCHGGGRAQALALLVTIGGVGAAPGAK